MIVKFENENIFLFSPVTCFIGQTMYRIDEKDVSDVLDSLLSSIENKLDWVCN